MVAGVSAEPPPRLVMVRYAGGSEAPALTVRTPSPNLWTCDRHEPRENLLTIDWLVGSEMTGQQEILFPHRNAGSTVHSQPRKLRRSCSACGGRRAELATVPFCRVFDLLRRIRHEINEYREQIGPAGDSPRGHNRHGGETTEIAPRHRQKAPHAVHGKNASRRAKLIEKRREIRRHESPCRGVFYFTAIVEMGRA